VFGLREHLEPGEMISAGKEAECPQHPEGTGRSSPIHGELCKMKSKLRAGHVC